MSYWTLVERCLQRSATLQAHKIVLVVSKDSVVLSFTVIVHCEVDSYVDEMAFVRLAFSIKVIGMKEQRPLAIHD
jgi:hypothetical protein